MVATYPPWIDGYAQAVFALAESTDPRTSLPFDGFNIMPLYASEWIDYLYQAIKKLRSSGVKTEQVLASLPGHSSMKFNLFELAYMFRSAQTNDAKVRCIVDFFIEVLEARAVHSAWWADTQVKSYMYATDIVKEKKLVVAEASSTKSVAQIIAGCAMLVHGLYNDFATDYSYDVYGPYDVSSVYQSGSALWVKEFVDLNPVELWPERKTFPYKTIKIFVVYRNVDSEFFYTGSHTNYKQNLLEQSTHVHVEVDGELVTNPTALKSIRDVILKDASEHFVMCKKFSFEKQKEVWLWQMCYQFKNFFSFLGLDWRPNQQMFEAVKGKDLEVYYPKEFVFDRAWCDEYLGANFLKKAYN